MPQLATSDTWLIRFIDRYLPEHIVRSTEDKKRQVRSAIGFMMASWLMAALFSVANFKQGNLAAAWFEVFVVVILSVSLPLVRRTGRIQLFGNVGMWCGVSSIFIACWYSDGIEGPALLMLPLVPAWAYLGYGRGSAVFWTWASIGMVVFLFVGERLSWVPESTAPLEKIQVKRFIEAVLAIGFGFLASRIFTGIKDYAIGMLQLRTEELKQAHGRIGQLFDSMREGVLAFDADGKIDEAVSARVGTIFGREGLAGREIAPLLFAGVQDLTGLREAFDTFVQLAFESSPDDWKELSACAPRELSRTLPDGTEQHLALDFLPVLDEGKRLFRIMLLVTDETERVAMQRAAKQRDVEHRREVEELRRLAAGGAHLLVQFLASSTRRLDEIKECLSVDRAVSAEDVVVAFQHIHTVRGEATTFQLGELARVCHAIEERLTPLRIRGAGGVVDPTLLAALGEPLSRARALLDEARTRLVQLSPVGEVVLDQITVQKSRIDALCGLLDQAQGVSTEIRTAAARLAARPFGESTQRLVTATGAWAEASDRRARVVVEGREEPVPHALFEVLSGVLTHLSRNTVAHGIEALGERERMGKPAEATLSLRCEPFGTGVRILVQDDGRGIDEGGLRAAARQAGLPVDASLDELLFAPGLSTAKDAGTIAGRGMGMAAVRRDLERAGYVIRVTSEVRRGTRIEILPRNVEAALTRPADNDHATRVA